jgi:predicted nucleotide-binding protein
MNRDVVYVVYGQDEDARESVVTVLDRLGLEVGIIHEKVAGRSPIIDLSETPTGEAAYAVVLLTPDDAGSAQGEELRPRARQNVLLELGYFLATIGRDHVTALVKGDVEIPLDSRGARYMPMDDEGSWRLKLAYDMKEAGLSVDVYGLLV